MSPAYSGEAAASFPRSLPDPLSRLQAAAARFVAVLESLRIAGTGSAVSRLSALERTLDQRLLEPGGTALLLGESEAAKSRFLDALLGGSPRTGERSATGARIMRSACTWITYGREPVALVTNGRGGTTSLRPAQLPGYLANQTRGSLAQPVVLRTPSAALESGLVLIDAPPLTPDTQGFLDRTTEARAQANATLFLIEAGRAPTDATLRVLRALRPRHFLFVLEAPPFETSLSSSGAARRLAAIELEERLAAYTLSQYAGVRDPQVVTLPSGAGTGDTAHRALLSQASALWQSTAAEDAANTASDVIRELEGHLAGLATALRIRARLLAALPELRQLEEQIASAAIELMDDPAPLAGVVPPRPTLVASRSSEPALVEEVVPAAPEVKLAAATARPAPVESPTSLASPAPVDTAALATSEPEAAPPQSIFVRMNQRQPLSKGSHEMHAEPSRWLRYRPMALAALALAVLCAVLLAIALRPHHPAAAAPPAPLAAPVVSTPAPSALAAKPAKGHRRHRIARTSSATTP